MTLNALLTGFLTLILFLVLAQGALSGKGILPFLVTPFILSLAMIMKVGGPLFLALTLVMILAIGVLMDAGPVAFLAVPLVLSVAVGVVLFKAIKPGPEQRRSTPAW